MTNKIKIINPDPDGSKPATWDIADAILDEHWTVSMIYGFIRAHIQNVPDALPDPPQEKIEEPEIQPPTPETEQIYRPFRCLGYNNDHRYYLPAREKQVVQITTRNHTENTLLSLAPLTYWERYFPAKTGIDWKNAKSTMFEMCAAAGIFDISRIRGRGGWSDNKRIVINSGNQLMSDGKYYDIHNFDSQYIYNAALPLEYKNIEPLSTEDAYKFLELCKMFTWEDPLHAYQFAGWCIGAPACGALTWRPHTWITGEAGTGKSWIMNNIVKPVLGQWALYLKSNSTEAYIRQSLKSDALPIMFDEFESEDREASDRAKRIIELSRQASFDDGAIIGKGGSDGEAISYMIRSMFMFSSINTMLTKQSDISRVTVLSLMKRDAWTPEQQKKHFSAIKKKVREIITPDFCHKLRSRTFALINTINANWEVFRDAASDVLGTQRAGDQTGSLIACAYSLTSNKIVTLEKAREWCEKQDWTETKINTQNTDSLQCLATILQTTVKDEYLKEEKTISEILVLVKIFNDSINNPLVDIPDRYENASKRDVEKYYHSVLKRFGVKYLRAEPEEIIISDSYEGIKNTLKNTSFANGWGRVLKRLPGAAKKTGERFLDGVKTQATSVPWSVVFGEDAV